MKCPKCQYLGFETGNRCKNCGYDFTLTQANTTADVDLPLRVPERHASGGADPLAAMSLDAHAASSAAQLQADATAAAAQSRARVAALPLFARSADDDQPLISVPAAPRPPLSVRRTPDRPRLRQMPKAVRKPELDAAPIEPVLQFSEDREPEVARVEAPASVAERRPSFDLSAPGRRLAAVLIDHLLLLGIDVTVVYFTVKMAAMGVGDWRALPPLPLLAFLAIIKLAYFYTFTLIGGQTVGKMAAQIRVVADGAPMVDPARAMRRTLAGAVSLLSFGAAYASAFTSEDRRAFHDRLARTKVVSTIRS